MNQTHDPAFSFVVTRELRVHVFLDPGPDPDPTKTKFLDPGPDPAKTKFLDPDPTRARSNLDPDPIYFSPIFGTLCVHE